MDSSVSGRARHAQRPTVYEINTAVWLRRLAGDGGDAGRTGRRLGEVLDRRRPPRGTIWPRCRSTPCG